MNNKFFNCGFKEIAYNNPDKDNSFRRNIYLEPEDAVDTLLKLNKQKNHVYTSIYSYHEKLTASKDVNDADVIFDRLIFDFDAEESDNFILLHNGYNKEDLKLLNPEEITAIASGIKNKEQIALSECADDKAIQDYYIKKYENNYLIEPFNESKKVAEEFKRLFDVEPLLFFTSGKGLHLVVLLNNPIKIDNVNRVVEQIGKGFKKSLKLKTIDLSVCRDAKNRLIRLPCSQHQKTKLFNNQIMLDTKYLDMIDNSAEQQNFNGIIIPDNDTSELESLLLEVDASITKKLQNKAILNEIELDARYSINDTANISSNTELKNMFLKVYKVGSMNLIGHSFVHLCFRSGIPKEDVADFFNSLQIVQDLNKVNTWIERTYNLDLSRDHVGGLNYFLEYVAECSDDTERDSIIRYFKSLFTKKDVVTVEELEPFKIGDNSTEYTVTATITNDKYTEIRIRDLLNNKGFNFVLDVKHSIAKFTSSIGTDFDFKYSFTDAGFKIKSDKEFRELKKIIKNVLHINLPDAFEYSLKTYLTRLYDRIIDKNKPDKSEVLISNVKENPASLKYQIKLADYLEKELSIKKTTDAKRQYYYLNDGLIEFDSPTMDILTVGRLQYILLSKYDIRLPEDKVNTILKSIVGVEKVDTSRWELKNSYYLETSSGYGVTKKPDHVITSKKLGLEIDNKFCFFQYLPDVRLLNEWEDATLTERTLRQILIPKDKPEDTALYIDYLERIGASFFENNIHKSITLYQGKGNNGKSILSHILKLIFREYYIGVQPKEIESDLFTSSRVSGKHTIILDELAKKSLNTAWDIIKRYSNGLSNTTIREMYSDKADKFASYGMLFICTNVIPDLPINDNALLNRLDILILPNRFAENPRENEYKIASGLEYQLENDFTGLEWLVNASIKAYKSINNGTFRAKQSYKETLKIIKDTDDILNYIIDYTELSFTSKTYNHEILANYRAYCSEHNISLNETDKILARDIGTALNVCYGDKLEKELDNNKKRYYNIRILSKDEIKARNERTLGIDENTIPEDWIFEDASVEKSVYKLIKESRATTISELQREYPAENVKKIVDNLMAKDLIYYETS